MRLLIIIYLILSLSAFNASLYSNTTDEGRESIDKEFWQRCEEATKWDAKHEHCQATLYSIGFEIDAIEKMISGYDNEHNAEFIFSRLKSIEKLAHSCIVYDLKLKLENGLLNKTMTLGGFLKREGHTERTDKILGELKEKYKMCVMFNKTMSHEFLFELWEVSLFKTCS